MREEDKSPVRLANERRNRDLDPQLVWRDLLRLVEGAIMAAGV